MGEGNPVAAEKERKKTRKKQGKEGVEGKKSARHTLEIRPGTKENSE